jgi:hypothetical protein
VQHRLSPSKIMRFVNVADPYFCSRIFSLQGGTPIDKNKNYPKTLTFLKHVCSIRSWGGRASGVGGEGGGVSLALFFCFLFFFVEVTFVVRVSGSSRDE